MVIKRRRALKYDHKKTWAQDQVFLSIKVNCISLSVVVNHGYISKIKKHSYECFFFLNNLNRIYRIVPSGQNPL